MKHATQLFCYVWVGKHEIASISVAIRIVNMYTISANVRRHDFRPSQDEVCCANLLQTSRSTLGRRVGSSSNACMNADVNESELIIHVTNMRLWFTLEELEG